MAILESVTGMKEEEKQVMISYYIIYLENFQKPCCIFHDNVFRDF
jgi:hypothetical protein